MVGMGGFARAPGKDGEMDDAEADGVGGIDDAGIHEELAKVAADVRDGGGIGRAEVDEQNSLFRHRTG